MLQHAPTLIVPVDGLPRNALVEVEVIAVTRRQKDLPYTCSTMPVATQSSTTTTTRGSATSHEALPIDQWPIWQFGEERALPIHANLYAELQIKCTPLALCSMALDIRDRTSVV